MNQPVPPPVHLPEATPEAAATAAFPWWHGAVIYQIYPRSFADSNGDGIGDLAGITARLEHIARLGADGIWISPFFTSPMADFGYDVSDYRDVDPIFGTLTDFDVLVARAHELGLKVMIDLVFAHTSDRHAWFSESRADRTNARADWYVWRDAKPDGTPPNNWQSVFGGPAWTWDARRRQYYYHQFLKEQPQLNVHNAQVQNALLDVTRYWLARGVDGFRFDALNHAMFDPKFRNNPVAPIVAGAEGKPVLPTRSFDYQLKTHSQNHPGVVAFIERIGAVCHEAGAIFTVAEVGGPNVVPLMKAYTAGDGRLSSAYSFEYLYADHLTGTRVAAAQAQWDGAPDADGRPQGWPSWAFENHDAPRCISRWSASDDPQTLGAVGRMAMALLTALRGNVFVYQGQELGLEQDNIPFAALRDPEAITNWPLTLGRDGVRTPIPWDPALPCGGFTSGEPWLPMSAGNIAKGVAGQEPDPGSMLHFTRAMIAHRRANPALRHGDFTLLAADAAIVAFRRSHGEAAVTCVVNTSPEAQDWPEAVAQDGAVLLSVNGATPGVLPAYGVVWMQG